MTREPLARRVAAAYLLTDQAYALSIARFRSTTRAPVLRWWYYMGAAAALWVSWQIATVTGFVVGGAVPDAIPLGFAVPMAFLSLLAPAISDRPTLAAALVAGSVSVAGAQLPANLGMPLAAASGVAVGTLLARRCST
jgi:predicted branched-subunit amino acid permease